MNKYSRRYKKYQTLISTERTSSRVPVDMMRRISDLRCEIYGYRSGDDMILSFVGQSGNEVMVCLCGAIFLSHILLKHWGHYRIDGG